MLVEARKIGALSCGRRGMSKDQIFAIKLPMGAKVNRLSEVAVWKEHSLVRSLDVNKLFRSVMVAAIVAPETNSIVAAATIKGVELGGEFNDEFAIIGKVLPGTLSGRILNLGPSKHRTLYVSDPWNLIKTEPDVVEYYMS